MTAHFKNRLIGTIVLVALLVIILPDLLDGKKEHAKEEFNTIPFSPEPSELPPLVIELDSAAKSDNTKEVNTSETKTIVVEEIAPVETMLVTQVTAKERVEAKTQSQIESSTMLDKQAWIIQMASFKSAERTQTLVSQLRKAGYQAHSYPSPAKDGELNRVYVGPDVSKKTLQSQLSKLNSLTKLDGLLRRYDPLMSK